MLKEHKWVDSKALPRKVDAGSIGTAYLRADIRLAETEAELLRLAARVAELEKVAEQATKNLKFYSPADGVPETVCFIRGNCIHPVAMHDSELGSFLRSQGDRDKGEA